MIKSYTANEAIEAYRFVKFDADGGIKKAVAADDAIIGVSDVVKVTTGDRMDVYLTGGFAEVEAGGTFSAGDMLTADENGKAVKAAYGDNIGAVALASAVSGDIVQVIAACQRHFEEETT